MSLKLSRRNVSLFCLALAITSATQVRGQNLQPFPLSNFDQQNHTCRAKGRMQDRDYCQSKLMEQILGKGKGAIPVLISQLTDSQPTKEPLFDYWAETRVGDIAFFILRDLFTEPNGKTFNLSSIDLPEENCSLGAESCWRSFVRKHGRQAIQTQWRTAWNASRNRIYWNEEARCFRIR